MSNLLTELKRRETMTELAKGAGLGTPLTLLREDTLFDGTVVSTVITQQKEKVRFLFAPQDDGTTKVDFIRI